MSIQTNFPAIKPTLMLDFANTEQLDPRITFTRASTATYYGTQTAKAEENLLTFSQEIGNPLSWSFVSAATTANSTAAPDGTTTADTLTASAGASDHRVSQTSLSIAGSQRVFSLFAKAGTNNFVQLAFGGDVNAYANFNITSGAGAVGTVGSSATASIVDAGGGWYRCVITTSSATASTLITIPIITSTTAARLESWTAAGTETVVLWGAQVEQRSAVTAYTATTTQPITNYIPVLQTAASGVARFEHNPTTFESLGLLIEEQRTNTQTYSSEFGNTSGWTIVAGGDTLVGIESNAIIAPDGTLTADRMYEAAVTSTHGIFTTTGVSPMTLGVTYTESVFVKKGTGSSAPNIIQLTWRTAGMPGTRANFSFATGTFVGGAVSQATVQPVGNGWFRISLRETSDETSSTTGMNIGFCNNDPNAARNPSYLGDVNADVFIWGAQLEAGAFPTSYIPTVASQVTRSADAASMTGANFSSWYRADAGSLFVEAALPAFNASGVTGHTPFSINNATGDNQFRMRAYSSAGVLNWDTVITAGAVVQFDSTERIYGAGVTVKNALTYATNDAANSVNGQAVSTDTSVTLPVVTQATIGVGPNLTEANFNGTISKIAYYPLRVTNAQLQALTS
jgi:hypothetical protein